MAQTPIERTSIVEQVKIALLKELKSGNLHRNECVFPIRTLASHLGSSRDAVWRALNELVKEGWLMAMQNRGYRIAPNWADKIPARSDDEQELVESSDGYKAAESRLSCQIPLTDAINGIDVTIAPPD